VYYIFRCTTDKLADALNNIEASGDSVSWVNHLGGRDWLIIARKGSY
jgi:hypothetical protein